MLLNKFKGAMLGGLVGDCLGATFEMQYENMVPENKVTKFLDQVKKINETADSDQEDGFAYTDDTAMARQIAMSFIEQKKVDITHVARSFTREYYREPWRGYGGSVVEVFKKLRDAERGGEAGTGDPLRPAREQFSGSGSYGNGAGMRAHPLALACYNRDASETAAISAEVARVTHAHHLGVTGGVVQTLAVYHALHGDTPADILKKIRDVVNDLEKDLDDDSASLYKHKVELIEKYVDCSDEDLPEVCFELGNNVSAVDSVPTALFCYLRVRRTPGVEPADVFEHVLRLAIRMGGDTDTIASMACAVAGAELGADLIPANLVTSCEAHKEVVTLAEQMCDIVMGDTGTEPPNKKQKNMDS